MALVSHWFKKLGGWVFLIHFPISTVLLLNSYPHSAVFPQKPRDLMTSSYPPHLSDLWPLLSLVHSHDRDHMIKRTGPSLSLAQKVRGVGLFDTKAQSAPPYYLQANTCFFKCYTGILVFSNKRLSCCMAKEVVRKLRRRKSPLNLVGLA